MENMRSKVTKLVAAAAVATATAVGVGGSAHAYTGAYSNQTATSRSFSDGTTTSPPPTQNLVNMNNNVRVVSKGVTAAVHFDPNLVTAGTSVAVTVRWGSYAQTSGYYNNTYGSRFAINFPPNDGSQRWEVVNVTMTETTSGRTYQYTAGRSVPIQAIWDVTLTPLQFKLLSDCTWIGDSDIELYFSHSAAYGTVDFSLSAGQTHSVAEFAKTWNEVGVSSDLRVPYIEWADTNFHWSGARLGPPSGQVLSDQRILPGTSHHTQLVGDDGNCRGQIDYDTYINVHTYNI